MHSIRGLPPPGLLPPQPGVTSRKSQPPQGPAFSQLLREEMAQAPELRFSAHAQQRLQDRNIQLSAQDLTRLHQAVQDLSQKGGREALLVLDRAALVVNVPKSTVITAMGSGELNSHVFTNIDSAVVIPSVDQTPQKI